MAKILGVRFIVGGVIAASFSARATSTRVAAGAEMIATS